MARAGLSGVQNEVNPREEDHETDGAEDLKHKKQERKSAGWVAWKTPGKIPEGGRQGVHLKHHPPSRSLRRLVFSSARSPSRLIRAEDLTQTQKQAPRMLVGWVQSDG